MTSLQTESGRNEQIHCRRRLDGKTKAVKGLAGQKELGDPLQPPTFRRYSETSGGHPILKNHDKGRHPSEEHEDWAAGGRAAFLVVPVICRSNPEELY